MCLRLLRLLAAVGARHPIKTLVMPNMKDEDGIAHQKVLGSEVRLPRPIPALALSRRCAFPRHGVDKPDCALKKTEEHRI